MLNSEDGGDLSDFITNGEWYLIGKWGGKPSRSLPIKNSSELTVWEYKSRRKAFTAAASEELVRKHRHGIS